MRAITVEVSQLDPLLLLFCLMKIHNQSDGSGLGRLKVVYVLPKYDQDSDEHFSHAPALFTELGGLIPLAVIIERSKGVPAIPGVKVVVQRQLRFPLRQLEIAWLALQLRLQGFNRFYVRISQTAAVPVAIVARLTGAKTFYWHSGMKASDFWTLPRSFADWRRKLVSDVPFRIALRLVHHLVTGPALMGDFYSREYGVPRGKIRIMPNDIDLNGFRLKIPKVSIREQLGLPPHRPIVLSVHRLSPIRRTLFYLPALLEAVGARRPDALFVLVGGGPEEEELRSAVAASAVADSTLVTGSLPNTRVRLYLAAADVFLMPSYVEGFPRVLIEAMAAGLPFATTDAGGVREIVAPHHGHWVVSRDDRSALADRVVELLDCPARATAVGREALDWVERYSTPRVAREFIRMLEAG